MGFNNEVNSMFIGDFINMIKTDIGENSFNEMVKCIGEYYPTDNGIRKFKDAVSNWLVKNKYYAF